MKFEQSQAVAVEKGKEVLNPFPLARELLAFADKHFTSETSYSIYTDPQFKDQKSQAVDLPEKFNALVVEYPAKYFVVSYEDRLDQYYAPGTRFRQVGLSTSRHRYDSDQLLREIEIREYAPSEGKGNMLFVKVAERINEQEFTKINTAGQGETNQPHGLRELEYQINSNGQKRVLESEYSRLDEELFLWKGEEKPVRWIRKLLIEEPTENNIDMTYHDAYLIGRDSRGMTEEEADIKIRLKKTGSSIQSIMIEIGIGGASSKDEVLFENLEEQIRVVIRSAEGMRVFKNQLEIIKQDPNYALLFEKPIDKDKLIELVESRVALLQTDWDKSQTIFS